MLYIFPIFPNYCEFFPSLFKIIIPTFNTIHWWSFFKILRLLIIFTPLELCTDERTCLRTRSDMCVMWLCYRGKSREDFSKAGMWGRCLIFWQLDTVPKWDDFGTREGERSTGRASCSGIHELRYSHTTVKSPNSEFSIMVWRSAICHYYISPFSRTPTESS